MGSGLQRNSLLGLIALVLRRIIANWCVMHWRVVDHWICNRRSTKHWSIVHNRSSMMHCVVYNRRSLKHWGIVHNRRSIKHWSIVHNLFNPFNTHSFILPEALVAPHWVSVCTSDELQWLTLWHCDNQYINSMTTSKRLEQQLEHLDLQ